MLLDHRPYTLDRVVRIAIFAGLVWGLVWLLGVLSDVLLPFAVALLLAYLMNPLVLLVQRRIKNRAAAVFVSLLAVLLCMVLAGVLVIPMIVKEIRHASAILIAVVNNSEIAARVTEVLPEDVWKEIKTYLAREEVLGYLKTDNFISTAQGVLKKVLPGVWGVISGTASVLFGIFGFSVIVMYLVFLLMDYQKVKEGWAGLLPPAYREPVREFALDFNAAMSRYFRGQTLVAAIMGLIHAVGFVAIGLPLGILLGALIGVLNMVPYLQVLGAIPALLLAIVHALGTGGSVPVMVAMTLAVFMVAQLIQETVLTPKIMGEVTGLSPAMIMLSLSVWGKLLGMLGLLIALPMTCLLLAYYKRLIATSTFTLTPGEGGKKSDGGAPRETPVKGKGKQGKK
jgi:predicted PurR-regulated permease PerM